MDTHIYSDDVINRIKSHLETSAARFITFPKFVFLCGKAITSSNYDSSNRGIIDKFLRSKSNDLFIVLSEKLWEDGFDSNIDLLTFEEFLAEVSDSIILFVESPGSFCELGAFSYANKLFSDKLIIVIDEKYKNDKSFIITGPAAKAQKDGAKVIFAPLSGTGLLSCSDMRKVIDGLIYDFSSKSNNINKRKPNLDEKQININSFIVELLELIKLLQPINRKDLIEIYKRIKGFSGFTFVKRNGDPFTNEIKIDYIIKLLITVGILIENDSIIRCNYVEKHQSLMFLYSKKSENKERNKIICRKYRYRGQV